jgi:hypothetical protein
MIEQLLIPALTAATGVPVRNLHGEQFDDLKPADVPLVVVSRVGTDYEPWETNCGPNDDIADVMVQIDYFANTLAEAWRLAHLGKVAVATFSNSSPLDESPFWESQLRVHRVTATHFVTDYQPEIV